MSFERVREKREKLQSLVFLVKHVPDAFLLVVLLLIVVNDLVQKFFGWKAFESSSVLARLAAPIILAGLLLLLRLLREIKEEIRPLHRLAGEVVEVVPGEGGIPCSELMRTRAQIDILTLAGGVIVPLDDQSVVQALVDGRRQSRVRCLIADPFSEVIQKRYLHDEPVWKQGGVDIIETRLVWLFSLLERLDSVARKRLKVKVYSNYPMISVFRADDSIFASYYGYQLRGHDTPMVRTDVATYYGRCVMKHFERLYEDALPITRWMMKSYSRLNRPELCKFGLRYSGVLLQDRGGSFILQRRENAPHLENPGQLSAFGGRSEGEESGPATAIRELFEETGLRCREEDLSLLVALPYMVAEDGEERCMLCSYFLLRYVDSARIRIGEGAGMEVLSASEALERADLTALPRVILADSIGERKWFAALD